MADPVSIGLMAVGTGASLMGGLTGAQGARVQAAGQQTGIVGSILQTMGQVFGLQQQANQYLYAANINDYQAGVAETNRNIALRNASYSRDVGDVSAEQSDLVARAQVAMTRSSQGSSGIDMGSTTSQRVLESEHTVAQYDAAMIRTNAAKQAYDFEVTAMQDKAQEDIFSYTSVQNRNQAADTMKAAGLAEQAIPLETQAYALAGQAGDIAATGSILSSISSVAGKWASYKTPT